MTYEQFISDVVKIVEAVGVALMVGGGAIALAVALRRASHTETRATAFAELRQDLGRAILIGLEILIVGDIIRTIVVAPTVESVLVLGAIVLIRILLSFSLEVEIDGIWPWSRWRLARESAPLPGPPGSVD
jgi:uncharacterized membrane protein